MEAWMRVLTINLRSNKLKKQFTFGANHTLGQEDLNIDVTISKSMNTLKDEAIVKIDNLTQSEITQLIMGEFYDVSIFAGYRNGNVNKIFDGGVYYISNKLNADKSSTCIIICTSKLVAKYGQSRINLTLNSGINLYSAIKFICRRGGVPDSNVSTQLKKDFIDKVITVNADTANWLDKLVSQNNQLIVNSDSILGNSFSIFDAAKSNNRVIRLNPENIILTGGYPRLTNEGLNLTILPTFNFMCGDTIQIDNAIVDVSVSNKSQVSKNYGAFFSQYGQYMVFEIKYHLQNRGSDFTLEMLCKSRDRISNYIGGVK